MTDTERALLAALGALEAAAQSMATALPKPDLLPLFERIEVLAGALPPETDPDLRHYLQRKSYAKARQWLEQRQAHEPAR
jgi:hypothetical protein